MRSGHAVARDRIPGVNSPVKITPRDRRVLRDLWLLRYLTTAQVARLHFGHHKLAQRRLRRLAGLGLVDPFQAEGAARAGFHAYTYRLTAAGARIVAAEAGMAPRDISAPVRPPRGRGYLAHHALLTDFRIWLREGCAASGEFGTAFIPAYEETRAEGRRRRRVAVTPPGEGVLVPDGVFCLERSDGRAALFCLELDRGTEPLTGRHPNAIERKLARYRAAYELRAEEQYGPLFGHAFTGFRILCLVPDEGRAAGFLKLAERLAMAPLVWVANSEVVQKTGSLDVLCWRNQSVGGDHALTE